MIFGVLLALAAVGQSAAVLAQNSCCTEIRIPIKISATNTIFPADLNITAIFSGAVAIGDPTSLPTVQVGGQYTIAARFCEPARSIRSRKDTLQVLVHGSTYTRNYWSGLGAPDSRPGQDKYSWIRYASNEGFPTLSIDSLCSGESSHLDPLAECQIPLEVEAINAVIAAARSGSLPGVAARRFAKVVYVGHSFGGLLGNALAVAHPSAVNAYLLTGFTGNISNGATGAVLLPQYLPAAIVDPSRFLGLAPGYLLSSNASGARQIFYDGDFSPSLAALDFATRGTLTTGEILTGTAGQQQAPRFTGPLFVLNGNEDEIFCEPNAAVQLSGAPGNCSASYSADVKYLYPAASPFATYNTAKTGHCLNLHETAQKSFRAAHDFLNSAGY